MIILCQAIPGTVGRCNEQDIRSSPDYEVHTDAVKFRIHKCHAAYLKQMMCSTPLLNIRKLRVSRKTKGILAKPMPKHWYDEVAALASDDPIDARICASKKPYFMIYRYPELRSRYLAFRNASTRKKKMLFRRVNGVLPSIEERKKMDDFSRWYDKLNPVQYGRGVMNRICEVCEDYFMNLDMAEQSEKFDPSILKTGVDYSARTRDRIAVLYQDYMDALRECVIMKDSDDALVNQRELLIEDFRSRCSFVVPSEIELCDIIVDLCYQRERSKQFAWDICGDQIVRNILRNNGGVITWPKASARGSVVFDGKHFKMEQLNIEEDELY